MTTDRIKEIQECTAYPSSKSVQQALLQVWNECAQQSQSEIDSLTNEVERLRNINISVKEILADTKTMIHQEFLMDDDFDGVWRDTNEIILSKINNIIPQI